MYFEDIGEEVMSLRSGRACWRVSIIGKKIHVEDVWVTWKFFFCNVGVIICAICPRSNIVAQYNSPHGGCWGS